MVGFAYGEFTEVCGVGFVMDGGRSRGDAALILAFVDDCECGEVTGMGVVKTRYPFEHACWGVAGCSAEWPCVVCRNRPYPLWAQAHEDEVRYDVQFNGMHHYILPQDGRPFIFASRATLSDARVAADALVVELGRVGLLCGGHGVWICRRRYSFGTATYGHYSGITRLSPCTFGRDGVARVFDPFFDEGAELFVYPFDSPKCNAFGQIFSDRDCPIGAEFYSDAFYWGEAPCYGNRGVHRSDRISCFVDTKPGCLPGFLAEGVVAPVGEQGVLV